MSFGICRNTIAMLPRCLKIETRNRAFVSKGEPKVSAANLLQLALTTLGRNTLHQGNGVIRFQNLGFQTSQATMQAEHWRLPGRDVDITRPLFDTGFQQFVD